MHSLFGIITFFLQRAQAVQLSTVMHQRSFVHFYIVPSKWKLDNTSWTPCITNPILGFAENITLILYFKLSCFKFVDFDVTNVKANFSHFEQIWQKNHKKLLTHMLPGRLSVSKQNKKKVSPIWRSSVFIWRIKRQYFPKQLFWFLYSVRQQKIYNDCLHHV